MVLRALTELHVPTCTRCGAPLKGRDCAYCGAHLTAVRALSPAEDLDQNGIPDVLEAPRPRMVVALPQGQPLADRVGMWIGIGVAVMTAVTLGSAALLSGGAPKIEDTAPPKPFETVAVPIEPAPTVTPAPPLVPSPTPTSHATVAAVPKMTNEQWGKRVVAGVSGKLKFCVEQDLLHTPGVPTSYTVTVTVGRDEMTSKIVFLTTPTYGFGICGSSAISRGFLDTKIHPSSPLKEEFTFVTNIAFPDAKPATVADHMTGGWP